MPDEFKKEKHRYEALDQSWQVTLGRLTGGIAPAALMLAFLDWSVHLAGHPAKQVRLMEKGIENYWQLILEFDNLLSSSAKTETEDKAIKDKRFADDHWQQFPYSYWYQSFLLIQKWWHQAATGVCGTQPHSEEVVDFTLRQFLDMISPSNSFFTNPEVLKKTQETKGLNLVHGFENYLDDLKRYQLNEMPAGSEQFMIGQNIAITPGKVVYRNHLIELIQYEAQTEKVYAEPVLITPAWIMKYYILDLAPKHSLVNYLVKKGHTVFMISWKNPTKEDRNLGMDDYLNLGIMSAVNVISKVIPDHKIHLVGYCLGGTLAAIAAATMARDGCDLLASMTLLAAQTDFTEPGELGLFIDNSQIAYLEALMKEKGFLDTHQMAGAFQMLRSNDLIWSRIVREYLLGERKPLTDLMFWNADATRLPYRMHSEYLRHLFLDNQLARGSYQVEDKPIALRDITVPIFVVATEKDHVSPWHSVFKINLLTTADVTFALTSGGHNVGIVSLPIKKTRRHYRISTLRKPDRYVDATSWYKQTKVTFGSWWPAWEKWLAAKSTDMIPAPSMGAPTLNYPPLENAPGTYVFQK